MTKELDKIDSLPTLPVIASQLLKLMSDDTSSINKLANLISSDPAITSRILAIANSAFYGVRKQIDTIRLAMVVLGINEIRNIILSISIFKTFKDRGSDASFDRNKFWQHTIATAHFARIIKSEMNIPTHGEEFTSGLIHDIGKIILDQYFHEPFLKALKLSGEKNISGYAAEKKYVGMTHMEVGTWLAKKWMLPPNLIDGIEYHHSPHLCENPNNMLPALIALSNYYANILEFGTMDNESEKKNSEEERAWKILEKHSPNEKIGRDVIITKLESSIDSVRIFITDIMNI